MARVVNHVPCLGLVDSGIPINDFLDNLRESEPDADTLAPCRTIPPEILDLSNTTRPHLDEIIDLFVDPQAIS